MTIMKYLIAFGLGFFISTAFTFYEDSLIEKHFADYCECKPK